jgi:hypothetical protein
LLLRIQALEEIHGAMYVGRRGGGDHCDFSMASMETLTRRGDVVKCSDAER